MPIVPDDKNWTWVLEKPCPDCGFNAATIDLERIPAMIRAIGNECAELLSHPKAHIRPSDHQWSAIEYGCHVRDVFDLYDFRANLMMTEDDPTFPNWDQDVTAVELRYDLADPSQTAGEIVAAADRFALRMADVGERNLWHRPGSRSDGAHFTLDTFVTYLVHDPIHHIWDINQGYQILDA